MANLVKVGEVYVASSAVSAVVDTVRGIAIFLRSSRDPIYVNSQITLTEVVKIINDAKEQARADKARRGLCCVSRNAIKE